MEDPGQRNDRPARSLPWAPILLVLGALALINYEAFFVDHAERPFMRNSRRYRSIRSRTRPRPVRTPVRAVAATRPEAPSVPETQLPETKLPEAVPPPAPETVPAAPALPGPEPEPEPPCDPDDLALTGIVFDPSDAEATFAVIDGSAVRAGETVGGWPIFSVETDRVLLGPLGQTVLLLMER